MGAGAMTICHNKTAVLVKEDMKKMVQIPVLWPMEMSPKQTKLFGVSLLELRERDLVQGGVPVVVRRMVEHLRKYGLHQEGLFRVSGSLCAVETLKQRLDSGEDVDFSEADTSTVASLLKRFLRDLPEGLVESTVQQALIQNYQECGDDGLTSDLRDLLQELPDVHYSCLCYLCHFLTLVEHHHKDNRMTALNLATVFGPSVFHVASGFEAIKEQNICNKIMAKLIQNYNNIFETKAKTDRGGSTEEESTFILVKEAHMTHADTKISLGHLDARTQTLVPRHKAGFKNTPEDAASDNKSLRKTPKANSRKKKVTKGKTDSILHVVPQPARSPGTPRAKSLSIPIVVPLTSKLRSSSPESMETTRVYLTRQDTTANASVLSRCDVSPCDSAETLSSSQEEDRPISPFYMSNHLSPVHYRPDLVNFLDSTICSTVQQHLFEADPLEHQVDFEMNPRTALPRVTPSARQRRRQKRQREQEKLQQSKNRTESRGASVSADTDKENLPSSRGSSPRSADSHVCESGYAEQKPKPRKSKHNPTQLKECVGVLGTYERPGAQYMEAFGTDSSPKESSSSPQQTLRMKIQELPVTCDTGRAGGGVGGGGEVPGLDPDCEKTTCEELHRLDLTAKKEDNNNNNNRGEPVVANPSLLKESTDCEEARPSPNLGGRLIRQLVEEDSDPMLSPRFYAYGQCQQFLDDTEVPPSPPNAHAFVSRRRSLSLGSYDDDKEELTMAQITKRIHVLKKKIHKFEERFEEERKYRPSHSDKAANPEVLRWVNELAKLRRDLKEQKLLKSEEDLPPVTRQRSNTLPKSFGSQLEKKPQQEKVPKPPVESTLDTILKKLQEKRDEVSRPEDIKDMTREQIGAEKLALQKSLLHYESIHGRPVTKNERLIMKPLYDRYRLIKQILCRATTIPVIEEEDGSEDEGDSKTQLTVTVRSEISVFGFLDHMREEVDSFISPVDELSPSKNTTDMRLSNLHSATTEELVEQLQEAREEKKRIRKNLREFEDKFFRQNGRNVQKEDRSPLAEEYSEYKHIKAKLRLLEVLISKRDSPKFI